MSIRGLQSLEPSPYKFLPGTGSALSSSPLCPCLKNSCLSSFQQAVCLQCCTLDLLPKTTRRTNTAGHIEELRCVRSPKNPSLRYSGASLYRSTVDTRWYNTFLPHKAKKRVDCPKSAFSNSVIYWASVERKQTSISAQPTLWRRTTCTRRQGRACRKQHLHRIRDLSGFKD
jgi:hypothetical protein